MNVEHLRKQAERALVPTIIGISIAVLVILLNAFVLFLIFSTQALRAKVSLMLSNILFISNFRISTSGFLPWLYLT